MAKKHFAQVYILQKKVSLKLDVSLNKIGGIKRLIYTEMILAGKLM